MINRGTTLEQRTKKLMSLLYDYCALYGPNSSAAFGVVRLGETVKARVALERERRRYPDAKPRAKRRK